MVFLLGLLETLAGSRDSWSVADGASGDGDSWVIPRP